MYRNDHAGTGYSPLEQIDTRNVANLSQAWTLSLQSDAPATAVAGVLAGESWEKLAKENSTDASAPAGGFMGAFVPGDLLQELRTALSGLVPGRISLC